MIIERQLVDYVVLTDETLLQALQKMSRNRQRMILAVNTSGVLEGIMTDGDFRRWLVSTADVDLEQPISGVMNMKFSSAGVDDPPEQIGVLLSRKHPFVPLIDKRGRLQAIAFDQADQLLIGDRIISRNSPAFVIAEIGNNHNGSLELAKHLVDLAIEAGADCVKFQMRDMESLYGKSAGEDTSEDLGSQYVLDLLRRFQLKPEEFIEVFDYCRDREILPLCTPWDLPSVEFLQRYNIAGFKVASADLTNHELLRAIARTGKPMLVSTGMTSESDIITSTRLLQGMGARFALLHCNSTYPAPFKDINLAYLPRLEQISGGVVGYSGHERGINIAIAAVALGARIIEKHFTVDTTMEGNDHKVSLLPHEFKAMVEGIREVEAAMGSKQARQLTQGEMMNREVLGKSLACRRPVKAGEFIVDEMLEVRAPGKGLAPSRRNELIGRRARRDMAAGELFFPSDIEDGSVACRDYSFRRPFGIPVRPHDIKSMQSRGNLSLLEFHLSYRDMDLAPESYLEGTYPHQLVIHAPELFAGDHVLDLCAEDESYRAHSLREMQRVIDLTRALKPYFPGTPRPFIIVNMGGFSQDDFVSPEARAQGYRRLRDSLQQLDSAGVELIAQTMPPFPWHFGGQRFHNLFVRSDEIAAFCRESGLGICLDISHSKLACNFLQTSFEQFVRDVAEFTRHLHVVDAKGVDGEGLQIGEGEIDFGALARLLAECMPTASFIPEIWQGHKDDGRGFWIALERLEQAGL
jgi:sialic acid synthase SpsE/sugar phosphate isomerase/epimerase